MTELLLRPVLARFIGALKLDHLIPPEALDSGIGELEAELLRIAADAQVAAAREVPLGVACRDDAGYPHLFRLHTLVKDIITMELPPPLVEWIRKLFEHPERINGDELQLALARTAISTDKPPIIRTLAHVILYEWVRSAVLLVDHLPQVSANILPALASDARRGVPGFSAAGINDAELDQIVDDEVGWWRNQAAEFQGEIRPVSVLLGSALLVVQAEGFALGRVLARADQEVAEELQRRDELDRKLKRMNAADAILVRNIAGGSGSDPEQIPS